MCVHPPWPFGIPHVCELLSKLGLSRAKQGKMAFISSAEYLRYSKPQPRTILKTFTLRVPDFMQEARLLVRSQSGRDVRSEQYVFESYDYKFSGEITVKFTNGVLEFANEVQVGTRIFCGQTHYGAHDVECLLTVTLDREEFQHKCGDRNSYGGLDYQKRSLRSSVFVTMDELENAVPDRFQDQVCLLITATMTIFGKLCSSRWVETPSNSSSCALPSTTKIPFLKHVTDRKNSDLIVECDGSEYPVHSLILKCISPVFTAMLETDMKEAVSGRIKIEDVSSGTVERMIEFIYTGNLSLGRKQQHDELSDSLITQLLHCADKYEISEMKQEVFAQMHAKLRSRNAIAFLKAAELYGAGDSLHKHILEFCKQHITELPKGTELQEFVAKYLRDLF